jgi:hypothetical protein
MGLPKRELRDLLMCHFFRKASPPQEPDDATTPSPSNPPPSRFLVGIIPPPDRPPSHHAPLPRLRFAAASPPIAGCFVILLSVQRGVQTEEAPIFA